MTLLQRYFWRQAFWPLVISLSALAVLALLTQSLSTIDLIVENRQSALTFFYITVLALPQLIAIILPLAVFMATLYAFNRLNVDSELVVAKTSGFSPRQIASPALRLATFALIAHLILNLLLQPLSFRTMRKVLLEIRTDVASQMLRPGEFIRPAQGMTVYAREILPTGDMADVLIYDSRGISGPVTHSAKRGRIRRRDGKTLLTLSTGNIQSLSEFGHMDLINYDSHSIDLSEIMALDPVLRLKTSDKFLHELFRPTPRDLSTPGVYEKLLAEGHARLSAPIYNIALTLLALSFLIRGEYQRLGYGRRIAMCASAGFVIRLIGFAIASAAESSALLNVVQYILPLLICFACGIYLLTPKQVKGPFRLIARRRARQYDELIAT
ncbi:MAG: LptF/LptG family permease [Maricaulaceae bacterium]